eukprot:TRINITY_DN167_c0_g2_i1.p1 TRINITY_DN167_c0_g2~~TRINITY_DN167_c0_g2_i1.p1  ORF type:complete len:551 (-),score=210.53 TRINITY_DN167_c0_g2_i1:160-1812(-)
MTYRQIIADTAVEKRLSYYIPWAKGFGNCLNWNCSVILFPMLRSVLRWLYNESTSDQLPMSRFLRKVLLFLPVDFSITIHRMIAIYIFVHSAGHVVFHLMNYSEIPTKTIDIMGWWPVISGFIVTLLMFLIFTAAFENVKKSKFEVFWYTHHLFVPTFLFLLLHGKGGWGPNYWKWFVFPGVLYALERYYRVRKANKDVVLMSVTVMKPNVISIEMDKKGVFAQPYQEGQYIFLKCPHLSEHEWHPFTVSSAPQEDSVTLHIRQMGPKSWTRRLAQYLSEMGPPNASFISFNRVSERGKIMGPDGLPLLCVDGPHAAPCQHVKEYRTVMVVGGGIGVTPLAATMKSIVYHRWKFSLGESFPNHAYFYWMCAHNDLDSFRWFARTLKEVDDEYSDLIAKNPQAMASKHFECHVFITSPPKKLDNIQITLPEGDDLAVWGHHVRRENKSENNKLVQIAQMASAGYQEIDLFRAMKVPPPNGERPYELGHIKIWNGRPNWDRLFGEVVAGHPQGDIGVAACANPMICDDLQKFCGKFSSVDNNRMLVLHKENF